MLGVFVTIITVVVLFVALSTRRLGNATDFKVRPRSYLAVFGLLMILPFSLATVSANEQGVVYNPLSGGVQEESLSEGIHLVNPFVSVYQVSTKLREETFEVSAQTGRIVKVVDGVTTETGGGQWATYQVTVQFRVERNNAVEFYQNFGSTVVSQSTIEARIREALQNNSVKFDIFSILKGDLNEVRSGTEEELHTSFEELGITLSAFIILDVDAGETIEQVVEDEATAAKQIEIATKDQEAALIREETAKLTAEINAEKVLIDADAQAEAERILKSVTANAIYTMYDGQFLDDSGVVNQTLKTSFENGEVSGFLTITEISDIVLQQLYYDAWDGMLPSVLTGSDASILVTP
jgi:regulator of protease activity HflC (stomatin/prohibitin superfamily)